METTLGDTGMKYLYLALLVLLYACAVANSSDIALAMKLCEPNGGLKHMSVALMGDSSHRVSVTCVNEAYIEMNNKEPR